MGCYNLIPILFTGVQAASNQGQQKYRLFPDAVLRTDDEVAVGPRLKGALVVVDIMGGVHKMKSNFKSYTGFELYTGIVAGHVAQSAGARAVVILADRPTVPLPAKDATRGARDSASRGAVPYATGSVIDDSGIRQRPGGPCEKIDMKMLLDGRNEVSGPGANARAVRTTLMVYLQEKAARLHDDHFRQGGRLFGGTTVILDLGTDRILWLVPGSASMWTTHDQYPLDTVGRPFAEADIGIVQWIALLDGGWTPAGVPSFPGMFDMFIARSIDSDTVPTVVSCLWERNGRTASKFNRDKPPADGFYNVLWDAFHKGFKFADLGVIIERGHDREAAFSSAAFVAACICCGTDFFIRSKDRYPDYPNGQAALSQVVGDARLLMPAADAAFRWNFKYWTGAEFGAVSTKTPRVALAAQRLLRVGSASAAPGPGGDHSSSSSGSSSSSSAVSKRRRNLEAMMAEVGVFKRQSPGGGAGVGEQVRSGSPVLVDHNGVLRHAGYRQPSPSDVGDRPRRSLAEMIADL